MKSVIALSLGVLFLGNIVSAQAPAQNPGAQLRDLKTQFQQVRQQALQDLQQKKIQFTQELQNARQAAQIKISEKKTELKAEIAKIKDAKKQEILSRVYDSLNELNKRTTDQLQKALNQIADVLDRVKSRTDKAEAAGKDVSAVRTAITNAENAIATARTGVTAQAGKVYTFQVGTDATLKTGVGKARQALYADLAKARDLVKAARDAVHAAAVELGKIRGVDEIKEPTNQ